MSPSISDSDSGSSRGRDVPAAHEELVEEPLRHTLKTPDLRKYGIRASDYLNLRSWR